jgi:tetratricopeptide (TPR) repeat protein
MSGAFARAILFVRQGRYKQAVPYLRDAIQEDPLDPHCFALLAICLLHDPMRLNEALSMIDEALRLQPQYSAYHAQRANILAMLGRSKEALVAVDEARRLDPISSDSYLVEAMTWLTQGKPIEAERAARRALALDPDNEAAADNLADALRLQGRFAESDEQIQSLLAKNPENPWTHASAGTLALQKGEVRRGEKHFLEALRLDPEHREAREGLLHSFRARSPFYRAYLRYTFFMERLTHRGRWFLMIGLILIMQIAKLVFVGRLEPFSYLIAGAYLLFVLWVWVAKGVGNLFLLFDRFARQALRPQERREAIVVGGGVMFGLLLCAVGLPFKQVPLVFLGLTLIGASFPLSLVFTNPSKVGRRVFGTMGGAIYFGGILSVLFLFAPFRNPENLALVAIGASFLLALATTWFGNIPALRR